MEARLEEMGWQELSPYIKPDRALIEKIRLAQEKTGARAPFLNQRVTFRTLHVIFFQKENPSKVWYRGVTLLGNATSFCQRGNQANNLAWEVLSGGRNVTQCAGRQDGPRSAAR